MYNLSLSFPTSAKITMTTLTLPMHCSENQMRIWMGAKNIVRFSELYIPWFSSHFKLSNMNKRLEVSTPIICDVYTCFVCLHLENLFFLFY